MLVLWEKTNHISIWIFIINVTKGVSLSTHLKIVFYVKRWIPSTSCSFQLTQRWCAPTRRTNVYRDWFRDSGTQLHSGHCQIDQLHSFRQAQTLHHKTLKLLPKIKTFFQQRRAANFALLRKLMRSYFVMIIRTL